MANPIASTSCLDFQNEVCLWMILDVQIISNSNMQYARIHDMCDAIEELEIQYPL